MLKGGGTDSGVCRVAPKLREAVKTSRGGLLLKLRPPTQGQPDCFVNIIAKNIVISFLI